MHWSLQLLQKYSAFVLGACFDEKFTRLGRCGQVSPTFFSTSLTLLAVHFLVFLLASMIYFFSYCPCFLVVTTSIHRGAVQAHKAPSI